MRRFKSPIIFRRSVQKVIDKAVEINETDVRRECAETKYNAIEALKVEHQDNIRIYKSINKRLARRNADLLSRHEADQKAYRTYQATAEKLNRISDGLGQDMKRFVENCGYSFREIFNKCQDAEDIYLKMLKDDSKIANQLGMEKREKI